MNSADSIPFGLTSVKPSAEGFLFFEFLKKKENNPGGCPEWRFLKGMIHLCFLCKRLRARCLGRFNSAKFFFRLLIARGSNLPGRLPMV